MGNKIKTFSVTVTEVGYKAGVLLVAFGLILVGARLLNWIELLPTLQNALGYLTGIMGVALLAKSINKKDN